MNGMDWLADTMHAAQTRLDVATTNLANAHASGYRLRRFEAEIGASGLAARGVDAPTARGARGVPEIDSAREMVEVLEAQRTFETAQKTAAVFESVRTKEAQELARAGQ